MQAFVHLHLHSEFSISDGLVRIPELIQAVKQQDMTSVAVTDLNNFFAAVKFYKAAIAAKIKPIFGAEVLIHNPLQVTQPHHLVLLCQDQQGYRNLTRLISRAYVEGQQQGLPMVERNWILENTSGLIALSAAQQGEIGQALLQSNTLLAAELTKQWMQSFPDRFYIELQQTDNPQEAEYLPAAIKLAQTLQCPTVATNNVRFIYPDDYDAHEARVCIHDGEVLNNPKRSRRYTAKQYLQSPTEMATLFAEIPEALTNSVEIAKRCNVHLTLDKTFLPNYPTEAGKTIEATLAEQAQTGLEQRLQFIFRNQVTTNLAILRKPYDERLQAELEMINRMGFAGYFLIVADFIRWANQQGIPVGPGRGSGAGSLVAYALQITGLDPLKYTLLFERFLNPERISMPDFDIDFCMEGRDRVIEYVAERYGRDSVSQIITYGTMAAKAVVRDVGRVLGFPYGFVDKLAKLIPFEIGITLEKALAQEEQLQTRYQQEEDVQTIIDLAKKLEGITRNAGKHAGGVVIAPSPLTDFTPLYCESNGGPTVTQFDKDDVEAVGLVKFDFLGLRTLTIIDWALQIVNTEREANGELAIDINQIPTDDLQSFKLLQACKTTAVFQLESRGMKDLIKRSRPDCFEDIIALVALFRPGPLQSGMVDDFINRKNGEAKVTYLHPELEPILRTTYGVILYQEQVMQIAQQLAGYSLGAADLLRRAMGKKKPEEMAKQRDIFTKGAVAHGIDETIATYIFDLMEKFAGYGFNKSHSAAYALVAFQTAWLKAHYPAAFMAAVLSSDMDNTDKVVNFIDDCRQLGLTVLPPNINTSCFRFTVKDPKTIIYGLGAIKGIGRSAIQGVIDARSSQGLYRDIFDFCQRTENRKINRRVCEALIRSGAMDVLGSNRATLFVNLSNALKSAEQQHKNQQAGQIDLFAGADAATTQTDFTSEIDQPMPMSERLAGEKATLGFYLSGHPLDQYRQELAQFTHGPIASLQIGQRKIRIAGYITAIKNVYTKSGKRMAIVNLEDGSGKLEVVFLAKMYSSSSELLIADQLLVVEGEVSADDFSGGLRMVADAAWTLAQCRNRFVKRLVLKLQPQQCSNSLMDELKQCLEPVTPEGCPVCVRYLKDDAAVDVMLGAKWRVIVSDQQLTQLGNLIGRDAVALEY